MDRNPDECVNASLPECKFLEHPHELLTLEQKVNFIMTMMIKTDNAVTQIADQVKPALDDLMKSPILKMLGMKK